MSEVKISVLFMREKMLFYWETYTTEKNFTLPPAVTAGTNLTPVIDHLYFTVQTTEKCLVGPHARTGGIFHDSGNREISRWTTMWTPHARRRGLALLRLTCSLWPSWPPPPRDGTSRDVSTYIHFVSKSTLMLLALKINNTFSVLIFFLSFADHFGVFVVNIKQHLTLRES